jgi:hypothetical protein
MPRGTRRGASPEVRERPAERMRQVIALRLCGISFEAIGQQLGFSKQVAHKLFKRALKSLPKSGSVSELRRLEDERIAEMRARLWSELSGRQVRRPDPENPGKFIMVTERPEPETAKSLIDGLVRISRHEAMLHGLDESEAAMVPPILGQSISDEELDIRLARLTREETDTFMMLVQKMDGRWTEPPAIEEGSVETTATTVPSNGAVG